MNLRVGDVLRIAAQARRASVEGVAGGLLERSSNDPHRQEAVRAEIDRYCAEVQQPRQPASQDLFLAELRDALPGQYAKQAERISHLQALRRELVVGTVRLSTVLGG